MANPVLVIGDDVRLCELLKTFLKPHGFELTAAHTAEEGLRRLRSQEFVIVILDIMLPDGDGLEVCKRIRGMKQIPVIMLTARGADEDKIIGLELGADDYLAKPFNSRELVARMKAVLRRNLVHEWEEEPIRHRDFLLDPTRQILVLKGKEIYLKNAEFRLLKLLAANPGRVFTRERLMDLVQGRDFDGVDRSIDVHISRLRNKMEENPKKPEWIVTVWGTGYRFQVPR